MVNEVASLQVSNIVSIVSNISSEQKLFLILLPWRYSVNCYQADKRKDDQYDVSQVAINKTIDLYAQFLLKFNLLRRNTQF